MEVLFSEMLACIKFPLAYTTKVEYQHVPEMGEK